MDYSKRNQREIEEMARTKDEAKLKKAGFDHRMQRVEDAIKKVKDEKRLKELKRVREDTLRIYNKYNNSNFKS